MQSLRRWRGANFNDSSRGAVFLIRQTGLASAWKKILGGTMKNAIAEKHGRRVCDVIQMLEAFAVAFNHREDDKRLQQVLSPMMKVSAHLLGETLQVLNFEAMTSPEAMAAYN